MMADNRCGLSADEIISSEPYRSSRGPSGEPTTAGGPNLSPLIGAAVPGNVRGVGVVVLLGMPAAVVESGMCRLQIRDSGVPIGVVCSINTATIGLVSGLPRGYIDLAGEGRHTTFCRARDSGGRPSLGVASIPLGKQDDPP